MRGRVVGVEAGGSVRPVADGLPGRRNALTRGLAGSLRAMMPYQEPTPSAVGWNECQQIETQRARP